MVTLLIDGEKCCAQVLHEHPSGKLTVEAHQANGSILRVKADKATLNVFGEDPAVLPERLAQTPPPPLPSPPPQTQCMTPHHASPPSHRARLSPAAPSVIYTPNRYPKPRFEYSPQFNPADDVHPGLQEATLPEGYGNNVLSPPSFEDVSKVKTEARVGKGVVVAPNVKGVRDGSNAPRTQQSTPDAAMLAGLGALGVRLNDVRRRLGAASRLPRADVSPGSWDGASTDSTSLPSFDIDRWSEGA